PRLLCGHGHGLLGACSVRRSSRLACGARARVGHPRSMSAEYEVLERKHQRLEPQNQRMQNRKRIHDVKRQGMYHTGVFCDDRIVVGGIGVGDTAAAGSKVFESTLKQGFESDKERARTSHLLWVEELLSAAELTGSDVILHGRDDHGNYGEGS